MGGRLRALAGAAAIAGCEASEPPASIAVDADADAPAHARAVEALAAWEEQVRAADDVVARPPWSRVSGPDPFAIAWHRGRWLGLLRGQGSLAVLDDAAQTIAAASAPRDATDLAIDGERGVAWVVGQSSGQVHRYALSPSLAPLPALPVPGAVSLRSVAVGDDGRLALGDPFHHRVLVTGVPGDSVQVAWSAPCALPIELAFVGGRLVAACLLDHRVLVWRLDRDGVPTGSPQRIEHDGPITAYDAVALDGDAVPSLRLALVGVEDRALDRRDGAFGFVDSWAFVVDIPGDGGPAVRRAAVEVAAHGVVTPQWVALRLDGEQTIVRTSGYGSDVAVRLSWSDLAARPQVLAEALVPGVAGSATSPDGLEMLADPLLDAWIVRRAGGVEVVAAGDAGVPRDTSLRLGEALAFTTLMAPASDAAGRRSRVTCGTCHFEGGVDGRTHFTGRADVFATTKPIRGLLPNRPHFSRALDPTLAKMVDSEFRVVSRGTSADPWFSLRPDDVPWLTHLGVTEPQSARELRRALMLFLMALTPEPNPLSTVPVDALAERGADVFLQHCEGCHQARLVADDPQSRVPRSAWWSWIATDAGPIVWAADGRVRAGVQPYVHAEGARVPSLRRLASKRPYFTHGGAKSLADVLARARVEVADPEHAHDEGAAAGDGRALTPEERRALSAFLHRL